MANETRKKRKTAEPDEHRSKRSRGSSSQEDSLTEATAGKIKRIFMKNFMCHDALEIQLNKNVNFIVGRNGSGKSAILTALVVGLGAKANVTSRGSSVKEFIKKGKSSALVEISLINEGVMAYKPEVYGNVITVSRVIGSTSGYKIKNANGEIISTKKEELERIVAEMNIQVDNPVSILNQDVSRTFLVTAGPKEKYELFMKATHLDKIGANYKSAQFSSEEAKHRLSESKENLATAKKEIDELEKNVQMLKSIEGVRAQHEALKNELSWSIAISEESKLEQIQTSLEEHQNTVENQKEEIKTKEMKEKQIKAKIEEFKEKIQEIEHEAAGSSDAYTVAKRDLTSKKEAHAAKYRECRSLQTKIKRMEEDIAILRKEIQRQETESSQIENEKHQVKAKLTKLEEQLIEVEAMLRTKKTEQTHLENNKSHLIQEERNAKVDLDQNDTKIKLKQRQLIALNQESGNAVTVFGPNMPRLLKRIKEEYDRGRFKQMPHGPLGAHIKMKDPAWAPAVENFLGGGMLRTFCADNSQDAKILDSIMKEVMRGEYTPQIITAKFRYQIHDVSRLCTRAPGYCNLLEAMEFSDPVVANCLIDQREVECVLLIPTSQEACEMLSDVRKVPHNCKRALTQQADTFFPDPNYRSYGGKAGMRPRFLQVSTTEAIKVLEEELGTIEAERGAIINQYKESKKKLKEATDALTEINTYVSRLSSSQTKIRASINELRDKCQIDDSNSTAVFMTEMNELLKKVKLDSVQEKQLKEEIEELQKDVHSSESEVKRCRDLAHCLDMKLEPIKKLIRDQESELQMLRVHSQYGERRLLEAEQTLQKVTAELEIQQRVAGKAVADAAKLCPRMNTRRSANEINRMMKELKANIETVEEKWGSKEEITAEMEKKRKKYNEILEFATAVELSNNEQLKRLEGRRRLYNTMKKHISMKIQHSFQSVLALRKYKGSLAIDHTNRLLTLEVNPAGGIKRTTNDARSLSGGERSYSTVAFILALWDCIELPFYFLDEFDVFMDKVNRRVIMDILLDHTRCHPGNQFAFLTPLDTSNILAEDYVTIHQLAAPERAENATQ